MDSSELLEALSDLCKEAGLEVRIAAGSDDGGFPTPSGICRVRASLWVVLSRADPVEARIDVLASALRDHAGDLLESRYLPPAIRARLETDCRST